MSKQIINPKDRNEWLMHKTLDVSSTESPALFGLSPYTTWFELHHLKSEAKVVEIEQNERMKWGKRLESKIAEGVAEDMGWRIRPMTEYIRDTDLKMGASFDFMIGDDALLEIKNVDALQFKENWVTDEDGNLEAPNHIAMQVQHQLAVADLGVAYVAALVGGNTIKYIEIERNDNIIKDIRARIKKFWSMVESNTPPSPDFERDAAFISKLMGYAEKGKVIEADMTIATLMNEYRAHSDAEKQAKLGKDAIKARILMQAMDAEKVIGEGFSISMGTVKPTHVEAYEKQGYRMFKPFFGKK